MNALGRLSALTRAGDWRTTLVPFILGCAYLWLWWFGVAPDARSGVLVLLSLVTTVGFASFGYVLNEWCDIADDTYAGKPNRLAFVPPWQRGVLALSALLLALLPWTWLPSDGLSWALIAAQLGCFLLYSMPFLRMKRMPAVAVLLDAAYAYVLPLWLSFHTYMLFAGGGYAPWAMPLFGAVALIGVRGIILHQVDDVFNDARIGIITLPRLLGPTCISRAVLLLLIAEAVLFSFSLLLMSAEAESGITSLMLPVLYLGHLFRGFFAHGKGFSLRFLPISPVRHHTDQFYQAIFPMTTLLLLCLSHPMWAVTVPFHLMVAVSHEKLLNWSRAFRAVAVETYYRVFRRTVNAAINYPIFFLFLLFGVNLRKENTSAIGYLRNRWGR